METYSERVKISELGLTEPVVEALRRNHVGLEVKTTEGIISLENLSPEDRQKVMSDILFFNRNPTIPLENVCSRFDNYFPMNDSQQKLLDSARKLAEYERADRPAGIWAYGNPGIGKTHIAVGLAKELMERGMDPKFVQMKSKDALPFYNKITNEYRFRNGGTLIIDDFNDLGHDLKLKFILGAVLNAHNTGGKLLVTTNMD